MIYYLLKAGVGLHSKTTWSRLVVALTREHSRQLKLPTNNSDNVVTNAPMIRPALISITTKEIAACILEILNATMPAILEIKILVSAVILLSRVKLFFFLN